VRHTTAIANINIALMKYWGKNDEKLVLPSTTSISFTLDSLYTKTKIQQQTNQDKHTIIINHQPANQADYLRVSTFLDLFSPQQKVNLSSENFVPTKAGLASSASAYASIAMAANSFFKSNHSLENLASLTRFGSGSAARSILEGFVKWEVNSSKIVAIDAPMMDIGMFVLMIDSNQKLISSREAMAQTKQTSWMYPKWIEQANHQAFDMEEAIKRQDFHTIGSLAQDNALGMHMSMMMAKPPIMYFKEKTIQVMHALLKLQSKGVPLYFTMDAGPNIKVLIQHENRQSIASKLHQIVSAKDVLYAQPAKGARLID
jgi:diphosphomevalonate decarboxylase